MKETFWKMAVVVIMIGLIALIMAVYGCDNPAGPSDKCAGYAGGNVIGKWKHRELNSVTWYRSDGTYTLMNTRGDVDWVSEYRTEGTRLIKYNPPEMQTDPNKRTFTWTCYEVQGDVMKTRDAKTGESRYHDRIG